MTVQNDTIQTLIILDAYSKMSEEAQRNLLGWLKLGEKLKNYIRDNQLQILKMLFGELK